LKKKNGVIFGGTGISENHLEKMDTKKSKNHEFCILMIFDHFSCVFEMTKKMEKMAKKKFSQRYQVLPG
jgi:dihydrodipicolinate reductase